MSRLVILLSRIQHLNSFESGSNPDFLRRQSSHRPSVSDWGLPEHAGSPESWSHAHPFSTPLDPCVWGRRPPDSLRTLAKDSAILWKRNELKYFSKLRRRQDKDKKRHRKEVEDMVVFTFPSPCGIWNTPARFWVFSLDSIGIWVSEGKSSALFYKRHCTRPVSAGLFLYSWAEIKGRINVTGKNLGWRWRP